jgi:L-malate glycosyltransferase
LLGYNFGAVFCPDANLFCTISLTEFSVLEDRPAMKHILYVLPYMNLGGTEKQAFSLMNNLQQQYHISLLAPDGLGAKPFREAGFLYAEFPRLEQNFLAGIRQFYRSLLAIQRQKSIDVIHVHGAHELILLVKLFLPKVPVIFTVHGYHGRQSPVGYRLAAVFCNLFAHQVITVSQSELQLLAAHYLNVKKTTLVYNGVVENKPDIARIAQLAEQFALNSTTQMIIGTAARLSEAKGLRYLILAVAQLIDRHPEIRLVIAGEGELEAELRQLVLDLNVSRHVVFAGYVADLQNLLYLMQIFVLPSIQEPFGLVCAEAMSLGKPIIGTNVGGIPEQVVHGVTGFIVPPADPMALADNIDRLLSNPALLASCGQSGYERYQEKFALAGMLRDTVDVYEKVLLE